MKQYERIKTDGETEVKERVATGKKKYYLNGDETFLENIIDFNNINIVADSDYIKNTSLLFDAIKTRDGYSRILSTSFNKIKEITTEQDIRDLITYLSMEYEKTFRLSKKSDEYFIGKRNVLNESLKENKDTVYFLVLKKTIDEYFNRITNKLDIGTLEVLLDLVRDNNIEEVLQLLNISLDDITDENLKNICYKLLVNSISGSKQAKEKHLCSMNCDNLSPLTCPKVYDIEKRFIEEYDFIKSGYQIYHEDEDDELILDSFVVTDCDKYIEVKKVKKIGKKNNKKSK